METKSKNNFSRWHTVVYTSTTERGLFVIQLLPSSRYYAFLEPKLLHNSWNLKTGENPVFTSLLPNKTLCEI